MHFARYRARGRYLNASITVRFLSRNKHEAVQLITGEYGRGLKAVAILLCLHASPPVRRKEAFWLCSRAVCVWFLPAVSRLERHPISCKHTHTRTHAEGGREREQARATHTLRGNPISWKSRVTLQLNTHLKRSCPKSAGYAQLSFLHEKGTLLFLNQ